MTNRELEQKIRAAVEHAAPNQRDSILSSCDELQRAESPFSKEREQRKGDIIYMSEKKNTVTNRKRFIAAAAVLAVLCAGIFAMAQKNIVHPVDSVVILDVNPSISLSVDAKERVLRAEALNEDAKDILGNMELKNTSLEVAVNAIIGSMLQKGYLGDLQNSILVSVENRDRARGEQLQRKVSEAIEKAVHSDSLDAAVLSQTVSAEDTALTALAEQHHISLGKAALIQEAVKQDPSLTFESLAPMTINEIALIASSKELSGTSVSYSGSASDKAYIGQDEALYIACAHAQVAVDAVERIEVEFDSEDGVIVYEVEFEAAQKKYEYDIDAVTGAVLKFESRNKKNTASAEIGETQGNGSGAAEGDRQGNEEKAQPLQGEKAAMISEAAAKEAALSDAGVAESDTTYVHCYLEYDNGRPKYYEVEFAVGNTEYEYEIDLYSGAVLKSDMDTDYKHDGNDGRTGQRAEESADAGNGAYIGEQKAWEAALAHAGVSESVLTKKKCKLEREDGRMIYEIEFEVGRDEYEYEVDAVSGELLKAQIDRDD